MSIEFTPEPRAEFEARITALLLGELTGAEAALLRQQIDADPQLGALYERLKKTVALVEQVAANPAEPVSAQGAPLKLSEDRRQKLLAQFKTIKPKEFANTPKRRPSITTRLLELAAVLTILTVLAGLLLPSLARSKSKSKTVAILNNLKQLDGAKQMWADENHKSASDVPTFKDIEPYLGRGPHGIPPVSGEKYFLGPVGKSAVAVVEGSKARVISLGDQNGTETLASAPADHLYQNHMSLAPVSKSSRQAAAPPQQLAQNNQQQIFLPGPTLLDDATVPPPQKSADRSLIGGAGSGAAYHANNAPAGRPVVPAQDVGGLQQLTRNETGQQIDRGTGLPLAAPHLALKTPQTDQEIGKKDMRSKGDPEWIGQLNQPEARKSGNPFVTRSPSDATLLADGANASNRSFADDKLSEPQVSTESGRLADGSTLTIAPDQSRFRAPAERRRGTELLKSNRALSDEQLSVAGQAGELTLAAVPPPASPEPVAPSSSATVQYTGTNLIDGTVDNSINWKFGYGNARPTEPAFVEGSQGKVARIVPQTTPPGQIIFQTDPESHGIVGTFDAATRQAIEQKVKELGNRSSGSNDGKIISGYASLAGIPSSGTVVLPGMIEAERTGKLPDGKKESNSPQQQSVPVQYAKAADISKGLQKLGASPSSSPNALNKKTEEIDLPLEKQSLPAPIPQPEVFVSTNAFSTFSLNIADVSFKLAQASLEKGVMPEPASIRSEEFINAFDYRDPEAPPGVPIAFAWERARYPFAQNRDLLRFSLKTAASGRAPGSALNIVLLLDNSGSMERADRVQIIREALRVLAGQLQPQDTLSIVTFARTPRLFVDGVSGSQATEAVEKVSGLTPQGGTNLEDAMKLAYETALRHYLVNGINRVVLLTDGAANLGNVDPAALKQSVETHRKQGVALDCFGIGWEGYNDDLLEVLARNGDGRYGFLNSPEEASNGFAHQLAGALNVAAADVKVQVEFNPRRVTVYRQVGYAKLQLTKEQFRDNSVDAAEIGAAEAGNALYVLQVDPNGEGPLCTVRVRYRIPGTQDFHEHEWSVSYTGNALALEQASPAMRLAATASAFSEWLANSPYASEVTPDALLHYLSGVPEIYAPDARPQKLEWMLRQAKSISGK
jgi:Mg-chelatase subunit ChlD/type II secretory pathway pseudopilin PulG